MYRGRFRAVLRAVPVRSFFDHRAFYLCLALASAGLLIFSKINPIATEKFNAAALDAVVPVLDGLSQPVATATAVIADIRSYMHVHEDNARLRLENARLEGWRQTALRYEIENTGLRSLLNVPSRGAVSYVSARVVAHSGGPFVRSVVTNAGYRDGIRKGQVALVADGLVGRVGIAGDRSARIVLLTDLNSRVPVLVVGSQSRAILVGDNTAWPKLTHVFVDHDIQVGQEVVTSGHGGVFPPGLTVGRVAGIDEESIQVQTAVDFDRLEFMRIAEYGSPGILQEVQ